MSSVVHLRPSSFRVMPWKNGLGTTTELLIRPPDATLDNFCFRVSIADLKASGPFSRFDEIDRVIVQLEGAPMTLSHEGGAERVLGLLAPYTFAGELATECTLSGASARDFNVMVRRTLASAKVEVFSLRRDETVFVANEADTCLVYTHRGAILVQSGEQKFLVLANEAALAEGKGRISLRGDEPENIAIVVFIASQGSAGHAQNPPQT